MQRRLRRPAPAGPTSAAATSVDGAPPAPQSGARHWAPLARAIDREARVGAWAARRPATLFLYELLRFGLKQAWACLFGALLLALLLGTHLCYPDHAPIARYDALLAAAVAIQAGMLAFRLETWEEARVIAIFQTSIGSWVYPEASLLRLGGVPLFTGFMYAAIGSYIARCWRLFDFR